MYLGRPVLLGYVLTAGVGRATGMMWLVMVVMVILVFIIGFVWHPGL